MENKDKLELLHQKLDLLVNQQKGFAKEIDKLRGELYQIQYSQPTSKPEAEPSIEVETKSAQIVPPKNEKEFVETRKEPQEQLIGSEDQPKGTPQVKEEKNPSSAWSTDMFPDWEKFIGENLISKVGIFITIIGVAIGAKYSIENNLVSPLTRVILGYLTGLGILGVGLKLKNDYKKYSAVLVSGGMTILYFITFAAYSFYGLFPQLVAFGLMVLFTIFTVIAALNYDRQLIAHIGLVGAYAVPFLLSNDSGSVTTLFCYMTIINGGILFIAFKKYWKPLFYSATICTWFIYSSWFIMDYSSHLDFGTAVVFLTVFFLIFYATFLAYKITQKDKVKIKDVSLIIFNAFIFYGIGYELLNGYEAGRQLLGLFTLGNGFIHFVVSVFIYKRKLGDQKLLYLISGLVLIFITAAIPVQLDGNWVTILWAIEAAILFWIGRTREVSIYEKISYPVMFLAFASLMEDWEGTYSSYISKTDEMITPFLNQYFVTSLLFILAFGFINYVNQKNKEFTSVVKNKGLSKLIYYAIPSICLYVMYMTFHNEIALYWDQRFALSELVPEGEVEGYSRYMKNNDMWRYKKVWLSNYSMLFFVLLSFFNIQKLKNIEFARINLALNVLSLFWFLGMGLYMLSELRESYLEQDQAEFFHRGRINLWIRYVSYGFAGVLLYTCYSYVRQMFNTRIFRMGFDILLYGSILWIASSELIHWMDIGSSAKSYKLELSIFFGVYSLILIGIGIWKRKKHLRIGAMILFTGTLLKLFLYDLVHLNTISKTIVLVSLGLLLLIISFLYNKYALKIAGEDED